MTDRRAPSRRPVRIPRWIRVLVVGGTIVAAMLLPFVVVVRPSLDAPFHADAAVVLSGDHGERLPRALELVRSGMARTLVLAGEPDLAEDKDLCANPGTFEVICLRPNPDSTRAEAGSVAALAKARHWHGIMVVTTTFHATRARMLFRRCFDGRLAAIGVPPPYGKREVSQAVKHEVTRLVYQTFALRC